MLTTKYLYEVDINNVLFTMFIIYIYMLNDLHSDTSLDFLF